MMFKDFINKFNSGSIPEIFESYFEEAYNEFKESGVFFLERDYILSVQEETNAFPLILNELLNEAEKLKNDNDTALYALFLYKSLLMRKDFISNFSSFKLVPNYPLLAFLCIIPTIKNTYENFCQKGLPDDVISSTMTMYQDCTLFQKDIEGILSLSEGYFSWLQRYIDCRIIHVGRLRYEIKPLRDPIYVLENIKNKNHIILFDGGEMNSKGLYSSTPPVENCAFITKYSETESSYFGNVVSAGGKCSAEITEFSKDEYKLVLKKSDMILSVHIPGGSGFSKEACESSYNRALEIFKMYFPEHKFKAFHCGSWMLSTELNTILKPTSNIMMFKEKYMTYPIKTEGEDVFNFVFGKKPESYEDLSEKTSLQRAIKELYLSGGYIYEYGGIALL